MNGGNLTTKTGVEPLCEVDHRELAMLVQGIPFEKWPQQQIGVLKPAMVTKLDWYGWGDVAKRIVDEIMWQFRGCQTRQWMLSCVLPGDFIEPHADVQVPGGVTRIHVPLWSNGLAFFISGSATHIMRTGWAYKVDIEVRHSVRNNGQTPRVHFMFDVFR